MSSHGMPEPRIAILVFPFAAQHLFDWTSKVSQVVAAVTARTFVVSGGIPDDLSWPAGVEVRDFGGRLHYLKEKNPRWLSALLWIAKAILAQVRMAWEVYKLRDDIDGIFCAMGIYYQLPILVAKLLHKKVISASMGLYALKAKISYGNVMAAVVSMLTRWSFAWSDLVVVESLHLGDYKDLTPFHNKLVNGALFLENPERFSIQTPVSDRRQVIGFIGRLVEEKGIRDFVQAIPQALAQRPDLEFLIIGTGILDAFLEEALKEDTLASHVRWVRWVAHAEVSDYLNQLKLLVVPSRDEGLPNIVLEAMGCGTPVLATSAGGIPDLITDHETGFVLKDTQPQILAEAILSATQRSDLDRVTRQAQFRVKQVYSLESSILRYRAIMERMQP